MGVMAPDGRGTQQGCTHNGGQAGSRTINVERFFKYSNFLKPIYQHLMVKLAF